jgi:high-affinity nickel-transport protein
VAFYIGTLELAQVLTTQLNLRGGLWNYAAHFNINSAGFTIVGIFVGVWAFALLYWRYGRVVERWERAAIRAQHARGVRPDLHSAGITLGAVHRPFTIDE